MTRFSLAPGQLIFAPHSHIFFDPSRLPEAVAVTAAFALVGWLFLVGRFSFGYLIGFYLYTMLQGYLWLNCFSDLNYDHLLAGWSAAASAVAFLVPAILIVSPVRMAPGLSPRAFDLLLTVILLQAAATIVVSALYNFRLVNVGEIYSFREGLEFPPVILYLIGMNSSAVLPFAFACFISREKFWRAGAVLLLLATLYPITLTKLMAFAPFWLVFLTLLSRFFETRTGVVLSLLLPLLAGNLAFLLGGPPSIFFTANFRMMITPSNAMDIYNHYFFDHDLTHFCQIRVLKYFVSCSSNEPLPVVMRNIYELGNLNASLFATEGVASVGLVWAPVAAFACGVVMAFANRLSAGLPANFILISGAVLTQIFLNVPMSTALLTNGAAILFLLWWITPRAIFAKP